MDIDEIRFNMECGDNLFYALNRVYMIERLDLSRPVKNVCLVNIETGVEVWASPAMVHHAVGQVCEASLPYRLTYRYLNPREWINRPRPEEIRYLGPDNTIPVTEGEQVRLKDGTTGVFLGHTRHLDHSRRNCVLKLKSGAKVVCSGDAIVG